MSKYHIVNLRYIVDNYHFDAAILYTGLPDVNENSILIELYNLDNNNWVVKRIYQTKENLKNNKGINGSINNESNSFVDLDFIIEETKKWIKKNDKIK